MPKKFDGSGYTIFSFRVGDCGHVPAGRVRAAGPVHGVPADGGGERGVRGAARAAQHQAGDAAAPGRRLVCQGRAAHRDRPRPGLQVTNK